MGNQAALQLTNIVAWYVEFRCLKLHEVDEIRSFMRYLDDILMIWRGDEPTLLMCIGTLNEGVIPHGGQKFQYTFEHSKHEMVFLDFKAFRGPQWHTSGFLGTCLYTKPHNPRAYVPFGTCHQ